MRRLDHQVPAGDLVDPVHGEREAGGLFGVAVLAAVFTAHGGYASPAVFMHGVRYALIVAAAAALVAVIPALSGPSRAAALTAAADPVTAPGRP